MPDPFFAANKTRKRKRSLVKDAKPAKPGGRKGGPASRPPQKKARKMADEELESDATQDEGGGIDDLDLRAPADDDVGSGEEDAEETPAQKRLRLAKLYLESVKEGLADGEFDAAEIDKELISARLKQDVLEHSGKVHLYVADSIDLSSPSPPLSFRARGHRLAVTAATASEDARWLFTAAKEGTIMKWDLASGSRVTTFRKVRPPDASIKEKRKGKGKGKGKGKERDEVEGHTDEVLALAVSSDGRWLASGGKDRRVGIWNVDVEGEAKEVGMKWVKAFGGHKDSITAIAFRKSTPTLYTASLDRTLRLFDLSALAFVETLFGHQDAALSLDALRGDTALSAGGRDRTARWWKVGEETQLVFRGGGRSRVREVLEGEGVDEGEEGEGAGGEEGAKRKGKEKETRYVEGSIDCVAMVDESTFISGGDSGTIALWSTAKKKPVFSQPLAHGLLEAPPASGGGVRPPVRTPRWITALACLRYADLFASGSWDGAIRLWRLDPSLRAFSALGAVPVPAPGVVNSLQLLAAPPSSHFSWAHPPPLRPDSPHHPETHSARAAPAHRAGMEAAHPPAGARRAADVLLVAALGREHRLGRWLTVAKEDGGGGVANCALVMVLPRTQ